MTLIAKKHVTTGEGCEDLEHCFWIELYEGLILDDENSKCT